MEEPFAAAEAAAAELARRTGVDRHDVAVVLGSGWQGVADALGPADAEIPVVELPGFPPPTVAGHAGRVRSVDVGGRRTLVLLGRVHLYEGRAPAQVVHGVRTAVAAGAGVVVLTNAAGSLDSGVGPGRAVLIGDHLNLTGTSPLEGPSPPGYPPAFVDLTDCYDPGLRAAARAVAPDLPEAVYAGLRGPTYETPAEVRMLRGLGAGLVGMSTVLEAIACRHLGARVFGLSLVTNLAAGVSPTPLDHAEVLAAGAAAAPALAELVAAVVASPAAARSSGGA